MKTQRTDGPEHAINVHIPETHDGGRTGHKRGAGVPNPRGSEQLPAFKKGLKGSHPGAMRAGRTKFEGYPDESIAGNGHPGAHQP